MHHRKVVSAQLLAQLAAIKGSTQHRQILDHTHCWLHHTCAYGLPNISCHIVSHAKVMLHCCMQCIVRKGLEKVYSIQDVSLSFKTLSICPLSWMDFKGMKCATKYCTHSQMIYYIKAKNWVNSLQCLSALLCSQVIIFIKGIPATVQGSGTCVNGHCIETNFRPSTCGTM